VYVLAGREKILPAEVFHSLELRGGDPQEVWATPDSGVVVRNPYFETISTNLLSAVVTDGGVLTPADLEGARYDCITLI